jgi:hypothetical protein
VICASWAVFFATFGITVALPVAPFGVLPLAVALAVTVAAVPVLHVQLGVRGLGA